MKFTTVFSFSRFSICITWVVIAISPHCCVSLIKYFIKWDEQNGSEKGIYPGLHPHHATSFTYVDITLYFKFTSQPHKILLFVMNQQDHYICKYLDLPSKIHPQLCPPVSAIIISASVSDVDHSFIVIYSKQLDLNNLHFYICCLICNYWSVDYMKIELHKYRCSFLFKALWGFSLVKP